MESKHSKYILTGLTVLCVLLICITSLKDGVMDPLRTGVGYFLIPIQSGVNAVGTGIYNEMKNYGTLKDALAQNQELKDQIAQLTEDNNPSRPSSLNWTASDSCMSWTRSICSITR